MPHFIKYLFYTIAIALVVLGALMLIPELTGSFQFGAATIALFAVITVVAFRLGKVLLKVDKGRWFLGIAQGSFLLKLILALILVMVFKDYLKSSPYHILPFLSSYVIFTIFETWVLMRISQNDA